MSAQPLDLDTPVSFDVALRRAIERRGLGLSRLSDRLRSAGFPVSQATLSYWQSGRSLPERGDSIRALSVLEETLDLRPGELRLLLPTRRRQAPVAVQGAHLRSVLPEWGTAELNMVEQMARVKVLSAHDQMTVDVFGEATQRIRFVVRALADGVEHVYAYHVQDNPHALTGPEVLHVSGARVSEEHRDASGRSLIVELELAQPLQRGEVAVVEYDVAVHDPLITEHARREVVSIRELLVSITFDPQRPPAALWLVEAHGDDLSHNPPHVQEIPARLRANGTAELVRLDCVAGQWGFRWEW